VALTQTAMQVVAMSRPRSARTRTEGQPVYKQHSQHATPTYNLFFVRFICSYGDEYNECDDVPISR